MLKAHIDFEGGAPGELKKQGLYKWIEHPEAQCWLMSWRIGERGPVQRWHPGGADPHALLAHVAAGGIIVAHNAMGFELPYWNRLIRRKYCPHWPALQPEQMNCTMARALALAIPGSLAIAAPVLGVDEAKDKTGAGVMMKMARPRSIDATGKYVWWNDAGMLSVLGNYCDQDVRTETELDLTLPELSDREWQVWQFDQRMNARGVAIDMPLVNRAKAVVDYGRGLLDAEMNKLTHGFVKKSSQAAAIIEWINLCGVPCTSIAKGEQDDLVLLSELYDVPWVARAIEIRKAGGKTSLAKLDAMRNCVCDDGRAYQQCQYHGAGTGRWAGRLIQLQNLQRVDEEREGASIRETIELLQRFPDPGTAHAMVEMTVGEPLVWIAKCVRSMLVASPGCRFLGCDLSNIEGCVNAWICGEDWKVQAYRDYQNGEGPDTYRLAYVRSFGGTIEEVGSGNKRQIGKVQELAFGFQGAIGSFLAMAVVYNVRIASVVPIVYAACDGFAWDRAHKRYAKTPQPERYMLSADEWVAVRIIVDRWRAAHARQVQGWYDVQDAAIEAVASPGIPVPVLDGRVTYIAAKGFLWCRLPSSRVLAYCRPRLRQLVEKRVNEDGEEYERLRTAVQFEGYKATGGGGRAWTDQNFLYGGLQIENIVQGTARDVMVDGALAAEHAGYPIVLTVHDEVLADMPWGQGSADELREIMTRVPRWCEGLPLAAKAWEDVRYAK